MRRAIIIEDCLWVETEHKFRQTPYTRTGGPRKLEDIARQAYGCTKIFVAIEIVATEVEH